MSSQAYLRDLANQALLPLSHRDYLIKMRDHFSIFPKVIYDIGSCVLHWTTQASKVWPHAKIICFEAMEEAAFLYQEQGLDYHIGLLSKQDGRLLKFYQNIEFPGGNSYYRENPEISHNAGLIFSDLHALDKISMTLDTVVEQRLFPLADLIKMDVQGAELDILRGSQSCVDHCQDLILELQHVDFNQGAPKSQEVIDYLTQRGFRLATALFSRGDPVFGPGGIDGDYHFTRRGAV